MSEVVALDKEKMDRNDCYSLKLKPQYVLQERASTLPPLPVESVSSNAIKAGDDRNNADDKRNNGKKKNRGRNTKRPRDDRIDASEKICLAVLRGETCPYGETCRFPHDIKAFIATRPEDIKEIGPCPIFAATGHCPYGAICRVGTSHLNMATGQNIIQPKDPAPPKVMNCLSKDIQVNLRKKTYPFQCKRHFEKSKKDTAQSNGKNKHESEIDDKLEETPTSAPEEDLKNTMTSSLAVNGGDVSPNDVTASEGAPKISKPVDMTPLPTRTRKIIDFSNKVYVAPLTTVGNLPFRRVMKKFGADITCGEMALAQCLLEGKASEWALLKRHPDEDIFGVQIAAGFPDMFTRTMELVENETVVDFVDLNLGCPLDLVCDKGSGASLMLRDKKFKECLEGITKTVSCPVTVKMRTGWDEKKPIAHSLIPKIQSWELPNVNAIMIHGRSRLQRYSKEADWDYIHRAASSQDPTGGNLIPVIGNGDILNYTDYEDKVLSRGGLSTCAMLARGALIKPWLPTEIKERRHWDISASERLDILKDFVRFGLENWGTDQQGLNNCRRFLLEWLSFLHRYIPVGLLEQSQPQQMNQRPPTFMCGRNDLETLFLSNQCCDWIKISEMLLGPVPDGFRFEPKHKANAYVRTDVSS